MNLDTQAQMQRAYTLIKEKRYPEARDILMPITRNEPQNADAWWLLANAQTDPNAARDALNILLRLNPDDQRGRQRLDQLNQQHPPAARSVFEDVPGAFADDSPSPLRDFASPGPTTYGAPSGFAPPVAVQPRPQNTVLKVLLIACGVLVVACLACVGFGVYSFQRLVSDPTFSAAINLPAALPQNVRSAGSIAIDEPKSGQLGTLENVVYSLNLKAGDRIVITLSTAQSRNNAAWYGLYNPAGQKVAAFDLSGIFSAGIQRAGTQRSSVDPFAITYSAPENGEYKVLIRAVNNINYTVTVARGP